eukprot:CCRYP_005303-RA/>CCRYP_005303-RA protein AED:0.19 eAED:0.19 QI:109/1/1/1/1/1/3/410/885
MASVATENANPNMAAAPPTNKPPMPLKKKKVSISPKKPTVISPRRRHSSSRFERDEENIAWSLDLEDSDEENETSESIERTKPKSKPRRRRRSSARFLRLSDAGTPGAENGTDGDSPERGEDFTSSEHLGEIYRQAIRMNAENKINAGNSWGLKLIENMDKFIEEDGSGAATPRGSDDAKVPRKFKPKDERGRVNFTKASCTLDASVKIYSYRVDDVHLSSYRVLANLNRTDNKKGNDAAEEGEVEAITEGELGVKSVNRRKNTERKGAVDTIETNLANINMSKLDSAYDIDPLFHKMSKAFDEGGAKGLLLGNLGVSSKGCHIVFDSKEEFNSENVKDVANDGEDEEAKEEFEWKESEIDISSLAAKLESMLQSFGVQSCDSVPFVPQLESLRNDYAVLEEEGFAVDEKDVAREGRRRLKLYDAPEEEEKEAEKSIHHIAMERSRGSVLGMSFDTNFRLSLDSAEDGEGEFLPMAEEDEESLGGDGEFAPVDFGGGDDEFAPDFGYDGGISSETFTNRHSYNNTKVLLDALCDGDAFYDDGIGNNSDYAFFDVKKFEKVTDGNLWAGSQHWKKVPGLARKEGNIQEKRKVTFQDDTGDAEKKKKTVKKDRIFIDFTLPPNVDSIFEQKKTKAKRTTKKSSADPYQMSKTEKDFLLPPDANVGASALTRLFSRPNAVVQKSSSTVNQKASKTVGFYDVEENALGFDCENDFASGDNESGGFTVAYGDDDDGHMHDDVDYRTDNFDEVRKVQKIDINYATVAKKVDVRRLKRDLWIELEERTAPEDQPEKDDSGMVETQDDDRVDQSLSRLVSFKETVEKMEQAQSQHDVTVSFYFICCLHLANEKGLKLDSTGLEDFMISMDHSGSNFRETFGDNFVKTANELSS